MSAFLVFRMLRKMEFQELEAAWAIQQSPGSKQMKKVDFVLKGILLWPENVAQLVKC